MTEHVERLKDGLAMADRYDVGGCVFGDRGQGIRFEDLRLLLSDYERMREALAEATSDQALQYLRRAYRYMETMSEALPDDLGLSLGNIALADDRDWLDCHIDWLERTARSLLSRLGGDGASRDHAQSTTDQTGPLPSEHQQRS